MKTLLLSLLVICCIEVQAQAPWVPIVDTTFGNALYGDFDYRFCLRGDSATGWEMDTSCFNIKHARVLDVTGRGIKQITEVIHFKELWSLHCGANELTAIPPLPATLEYLGCSSNDITSFAPLPPRLEYLDCFRNNLTSLPSLPSTLYNLNCGENMLTSLPALPDTMGSLRCEDNQITSLPPLPPDLWGLACYNNPLLTALPAPLPNRLLQLGCHHCQLTSLPTLPNTLTFLNCESNQITTIPNFPDSLGYCYIQYNPISCLPPLKKINDLKFFGTQVTCLPNYGQVNSSSPVLSSLPLCDLFNPWGCTAFWTISGRTFTDNDSNCVAGTSEGINFNVKINVYENGNLSQQTFTGYDGYYNIIVDSGSYVYTVDTTNLLFNIGCPSSGYHTSVINAADSVDAGMDFGLTCNGFDVAAHSIVAFGFRPGQTTAAIIQAGDLAAFYGGSCAANVSGTVTVQFSGPASFVSPGPGALTPVQVGNTLTYQVSDFAGVDFRNDFGILLHTDSTATTDSVICITVTVVPNVADRNATNNTLTICFPVGTSFDPNDKQVYPLAAIDSTQEWLTYTVRFQNTGTAEALHIYIDDTLDSDLDAASFELLDYSHQPQMQIKNEFVRFNFPGINLPDSTSDEPGSHGYVQYRVKLKQGLTVGTVINNTAAIYFDFNAPVITNTTTNTIEKKLTIGINTPQENALLFLYPNPADGAVTITMSKAWPDATLTITDITGKTVLRMPINTQQLQFATDQLANGVYFVRVISKEGRITAKKLVVNR